MIKDIVKTGTPDKNITITVKRGDGTVETRTVKEK